jgi:two-component system chemotaxis sensor kinase CheA
VLRLRDRLLPLICLQSLLALEPPVEPSGETCIVVLRVGAYSFGVIVDRVFDTEEIVVKPVAKVLRHLKFYSGATILGDGSVILILDPKGVSVEAGAGQVATPVAEGAQAADIAPVLTPLLVFRAANDLLKAAPLAAVSRIEEITDAQIETADSRTVIQYRSKLMPILDAAGRPVKPWEGGGRRPLLVFARGERTAGLLVEEVVDIVNCRLEMEVNAAGAGAVGSLIVGGRATELIDVDYFCGRALNDPAMSGAAPNASASAAGVRGKRLLVVDSGVYAQNLLQPLLRRAGYDVTVASGPEAALVLHEAGEAFDLIVADVGDGPAASRGFAAVLGAATDWRQTPLLDLTPFKRGDGVAASMESAVLDAVCDASGLRGAA